MSERQPNTFLILSFKNLMNCSDMSYFSKFGHVSNSRPLVQLEGVYVILPDKYLSLLPKKGWWVGDTRLHVMISGFSEGLIAKKKRKKIRVFSI